MAEVILDQIHKTYPGGFKAVDNVSLHIPDQQFVVLVGPSGCGKSTTLRMVAGLEEITGGTIRIGDRVINDVAPKDRDIAMVFQNYALYPHMNVYKNMAFGLLLRRRHGFWDNPLWAVAAPGKYRAAREERQAIDERVRGAAETLGITSLLARRPKELSGGQRQRVAVGRAIVRRPKAYLFDEPLSNLDAKLRVQMRSEIKKLHKQMQTTTIYVTHDQEEAMTLGDRVVVMKDGRIQQADSPFNVYEHPTNRFVAGFVGMPPMNFFDGRLVNEGGQLFFADGANRVPLPAATAAKLASRAGGEVVFGVRAEGLHPAAEGEAGTIRIRVAVVEPLGDRMDVIGETERGAHVVCRVDARARVSEGGMLPLRVDHDRAHFFETGDVGRNLLLA
ncbi:MAG: ATP-binding cassette domain-containing protein [Phycisphaerae bacterium]|nr:ATP-binding cassette domain-containing protein [Phycisphaerae bacterium]